MIDVTLAVRTAPRTVADVRQWLREIDSLHLPDETPLDEGLLCVYTSGEHRFEFIECGDHIGIDAPQDVLIYLHECRSDYGYQEEKPE